MNCLAARNHLLASEHPDRPAAAVACHLEGCPACRRWHQRLARIERDLPRLAVPPSSGKQRLLALLVRQPGDARRPSTAGQRRESGRQKVALACALAASLLVFALGWWALPRQSGEGPSAYEQERDKKWVHADTPHKRVAILTNWAEEMVNKAKDARDDAPRLAELAADFTRLVQTDLPEQARAVPRHQREKLVASVRDRLSRVESEAARLAAGPGSAESAKHLLRIASAARAADRRLAQLVGRA